MPEKEAIRLRNKEVAITRWTRIQRKERECISNSLDAMILKCALCGFLAGDGNITVRKVNNYTRYEVRFFPDDGVMLNCFLSFVEELYSKRPSYKNFITYYYVRITRKTMAEDIISLAKFGVKQWTIPTLVYENENAAIAWLKAFFSAEAYVNRKVIRIQTINLDSMKNLSLLLLNFEILNKHYIYYPSMKNHSPVGIIIISDRHSREIFLERIGFWHSKKEASLRKALSL